MSKEDTLWHRDRDKKPDVPVALQAESFLSIFWSKSQADHNLIKKTDMLSSFNRMRKGATFLPQNIHNFV